MRRYGFGRWMNSFIIHDKVFVHLLIRSVIQKVTIVTLNIIFSVLGT